MHVVFFYDNTIGVMVSTRFIYTKKSFQKVMGTLRDMAISPLTLVMFLVTLNKLPKELSSF